MFRDQLLAGRRILVTGGGTGLGKAMAARFLQLGAEVHICGRRKSVCDETATELMDLHGGRVMSYGVDIRDAAGIMGELQSCRNTFPQHYIKVNAFDSSHGRESLRISISGWPTTSADVERAAAAILSRCS